MGAALDLSERLLCGAADAAVEHPFAPLLVLEDLGGGLGFVSSFANVAALQTGEGLVLFDAAAVMMAAATRALVRGFRAAPVHTLVYTHGHVDHVGGAEAFLEGSPGARVLAQEALPARLDRYLLTKGYNACINSRQFRVPVRWPDAFRYPDEVFRGDKVLEIGGQRVELHAARGETDDHAWAYLPGPRALCTGDLFIWAVPNCGNPQKVQRYPREWAQALRQMAALRPAVLVPGHGPPITGEERVVRALSETAEPLESLCDQVLRLMNAGARLEEVMASARAPAHLLERPYLRPIYDDPSFIVRNLWRLYGGWWDGDPAHLLPAPAAQLAGELAALAGGAAKLAERAEALLAAGDLPLAAHLAELAARAAPGDDAIRQVRAAVYRRRAEAEPSLMARNIFLAAAAE